MVLGKNLFPLVLGIAIALVRSSVSYVVWCLVVWLCYLAPVLGKMVAVTMASGAMARLMEEELKLTPTDECGMMANGIMMIHNGTSTTPIVMRSGK